MTANFISSLCRGWLGPRPCHGPLGRALAHDITICLAAYLSSRLLEVRLLNLSPYATFVGAPLASSPRRLHLQASNRNHF